MDYFDRGDYSYKVTADDLRENLLMDARNGDATVNLFEMVYEWVTWDGSRGDITANRDVLVEIPATMPNLFGNGTSIDRANRRVIDDQEVLVELAAYIQDGPATGAGYAVNVSDLLRHGGEIYDADAYAALESEIDQIRNLRDYPILDEEVWSEVEDEENHENWMDYGAADSGILEHGETFKDGDGSIPLAILIGQWHTGTDEKPDWHNRTEELLIVEHTGYDTTFLIDPEDIGKAREAIAEHIVPA